MVGTVHHNQLSCCCAWHVTQPFVYLIPCQGQWPASMRSLIRPATSCRTPILDQHHSWLSHWGYRDNKHQLNLLQPFIHDRKLRSLLLGLSRINRGLLCDRSATRPPFPASVEDRVEQCRNNTAAAGASAWGPSQLVPQYLLLLERTN
jgi:hypothetical protein